MKLFFYAPNVRAGGGLVLLKALLSDWENRLPLVAFLDTRIKEQVSIPENVSVHWVVPTVLARFGAEVSLSKLVSKEDIVVCFHGLPPLLARARRVSVFVQNRILLEPTLAKNYRASTRLRLMAERAIFRQLKFTVSEYVVQTPSMKQALNNCVMATPSSHSAPLINVLPFVQELTTNNDHAQTRNWDFAYIADGEGHKNHTMLLAAWLLLAEEDLRPSLVITLGARDQKIWAMFDRGIASHNLKVTNLGILPRAEVDKVYAQSGALIFPSTCESFGLPLIEASNAGLPIIASELDYVRDVCVPEHTFNPQSAVSIARAVKRHLGVPTQAIQLQTPKAFWQHFCDPLPPTHTPKN